MGSEMCIRDRVNAGSTINKDVSGVGNVRVQVVIDGSVVQDREL